MRVTAGIQRVVAFRTLEHQKVIDVRLVPNRAVGKVDFFNGVLASGFVVEMVIHRDFVGAVLDAQNQVVAGTPCDYFIRVDAFGKLKGVFIACRRVVVVNGVLTIATIEDVGVVTRAAIQIIVARAADERVVSSFAVLRVVAFTAVQDIVTCAAVEGVITLSTVKQVISSFASQGVVTFVAVQSVFSRVTVQGIVTQTAG